MNRVKLILFRVSSSFIYIPIALTIKNSCLKFYPVLANLSVCVYSYSRKGYRLGFGFLSLSNFIESLSPPFFNISRFQSFYEFY